MLKALTASAVLFACPVVAQCIDADRAHIALTQKYGESPVSASVCGVLGSVGRCIQWSNRNTGTWTWVFYPGDGQACVIGSGTVESEDS